MSYPISHDTPSGNDHLKSSPKSFLKYLQVNFWFRKIFTSVWINFCKNVEVPENVRVWDIFLEKMYKFPQKLKIEIFFCKSAKCGKMHTDGNFYKLF